LAARYMKTPSFVRITLRASKLQVRYREHVITNSYGELFQHAFDAEVTTIAAALQQFEALPQSRYRQTAVHSDSTSAIERA